MEWITLIAAAFSGEFLARPVREGFEKKTLQINHVSVGSCRKRFNNTPGESYLDTPAGQEKPM